MCGGHKHNGTHTVGWLVAERPSNMLVYLRGRTCSDKCVCRHTEVEVAGQTFHLIQPKHTDTGPTSSSADPTTPGAWQGSHWSSLLVEHWYGSTWKHPKAEIEPRSAVTEATASLAEWLWRPPRERKVPGSNPACAGVFSGSSHTSDLNIGTPVAALPGAWRYRVSAGTGRPGVSIL